MKALLILTLSIFTITLTAQAEPDAESIAASEKLLNIMGVKEQTKAGFSAMLPIVDQLSAQWGLDAAGKTELTQIYKDWFEEDIDHDAMYQEMVKLYAEVFTKDEMDELSTFYQTPVGQKVLKALPELTQKGAELGMVEGEAKQAELINRLTPFLEARGIQ